MKHSSRMINNIKEELSKNRAKQYDPDEYGRTNYGVVDKGESIPRFITAMPYRKRGKTNDKWF